jgi:hypothetical protein
MVVVLVAVLLVASVIAHSAGNPPEKKHHCTHGVSSIGPVTVENGRIVGGSTVPHTQACLR